MDPDGKRIFVGNISNRDDRDELLRRANYTYGCESCVTVDGDGYLQVETTGLSQRIIDATQFLTDAINSTDPFQLYDVQIKNNDPDVAFGDSQRGMGNVTVKRPDGTSQKVTSIKIRLDFGDDAYVIGNAQLRESYLNLVFAHEVSHFAPGFKEDPTTLGERGDVDNPINEIRAARGLPLRAEYQARNLHVGGLVYLKFGDAVRDPKFGVIIRGSDGINVQDQPGRIILWWQNKIKR